MTEQRKTLVIGVNAGSLFDMRESDEVFRQGQPAYREFQDKHQDTPLEKGPLFHFVSLFLNLNQLRADGEDPLVDVVVMSRNDAQTGLRIQKSIAHYDLDIARSCYLDGESPSSYLDAYNVALFLSTNRKSVLEAIQAGHGAGHVNPISGMSGKSLDSLRIAFDFDGVVVDDESESVYMESGCADTFDSYEIENRTKPHNAGPLKRFFEHVKQIHEIDSEVNSNHREKLIKIAIITSRGTRTQERFVRTFEEWGINPGMVHFLKGMNKRGVVQAFKPQIYFDDQVGHLEDIGDASPLVHVPFGVRNKQ